MVTSGDEEEGMAVLVARTMRLRRGQGGGCFGVGSEEEGVEVWTRRRA